MVCLRCTGAPASTFRRSHKRQREEEAVRGEREADERQDGEQRGDVGEGSVLVSLSLTLGVRDKPLLMEEINFGLNRSLATL